ncbi:hypothetical protein PN36_18085 [Candidatus Thiomargarita nelsonii]|uniref:Uncharacterized protein n=1 Tax=Candidatus Thiomargarita nelsonii TaxID=1003181 RepID=A0A4E0QQ70_9GAMM|nr:hypothetical protein PN36_18085 [Candidatus Thiomargarita nelsonii]
MLVWFSFADFKIPTGGNPLRAMSDTTNNYPMVSFSLQDAERPGRHDLHFVPLLRFPRRAWEREKNPIRFFEKIKLK